MDFDRAKYDSAFLPKFQESETLKFIENKENIILIGTPGAGKTHYATALGSGLYEGAKRFVLYCAEPYY